MGPGGRFGMVLNREGPERFMLEALQGAVVQVDMGDDGIILQWTWDAEAVDLDACCQEILRMVESFLQDTLETE